jgi:hypothetical protein
MKILLTEILDEVLGIPEGLIETSREIYNKIVEDLKKKAIAGEDVDSYKFKIHGDFHIADYNFDTINVEININTNNSDEIDWGSMGVAHQVTLDKPYKFVKSVIGKTVNLIIDLSAGDTKTWKDIVDFFEGENKTTLASSIAHELKHGYDNYKKPSRPVTSTIRYGTISKNMGFPPIDKFMYYLYYTTLVEFLVRASEVGSYLKDSGATKKDFLNMLQKSRTYQILKDSKDITYDNMVKEITDNPIAIEALKGFFKRGGENVDNLSNEEIAKKMLKFHFNYMKSHMKEEYERRVKGNAFPALFSLFGQFMDEPEIEADEQEAIDNFNKEIERFSDDDFEKFYRYEEKKMHLEADKALRKIAKLYAYLD